MSTIPDIIPITDLRQDAAKVLDRVKSSGKPLIVTQRGRAAAVMVSVERYEAQEREQEILRRIARGEREILEGKGYGLRAVMKEADRIVKGQ